MRDANDNSVDASAAEELIRSLIGNLQVLDESELSPHAAALLDNAIQLLIEAAENRFGSRK